MNKSLLFILLLFIPSVSAGPIYYTDIDVRRYMVHNDTEGIENPVSSGVIHTTTFIDLQPHNYEVINSTYYIHVFYRAFIQHNSVGVWDVYLSNNGTRLCGGYIATRNIPAIGGFVTSGVLDIRCSIGVKEYGLLEVNRVVLSGNPAVPITESIAEEIQKEDEIITHHPELAIFLESILFLLVSIVFSILSKYHNSPLYLMLSGFSLVIQSIYGLAFLNYSVLEMTGFLAFGVGVIGTSVSKMMSSRGA